MFITTGKTKQRNLPGPKLFPLREDMKKIGGSTFLNYGLSSLPVTDGTQITESDGNRWPPPKKKGTFYDSGSEFYSSKLEWVSPGPPKGPYSMLHPAPEYQGQTSIEKVNDSGSLIANCLVVSDVDVKWGYPGAANTWRINWPPDLSSSRAALVAKGTTAIAATAPTNAIAQAASAIGELLQDVPKLPGIHLWESRLQALMTLSAAGSEFLNYQFGIAPTISDMMSFLEGAHKVDKAVDQVIRDSGRVVRRRFHFPKEESTTAETLFHTFSPAGFYRLPIGLSTDSRYVCDAWPNHGASFPSRTTIRERTVEREVWFSGAFTYHLPGWFDTHSKSDRRLLMAKLFGAEPDLNTLWQLTPWSWAVDWFSNAGSFVKNLQNKISYGTVLRYGYVMEKTTVTDTYSAGALLPNTALPGAYSLPYPTITQVKLRRTTKKRVKANPFGFGLSWDGLSPTQLAIAAALGITRVV